MNLEKKDNEIINSAENNVPQDNPVLKWRKEEIYPDYNTANISNVVNVTSVKPTAREHKNNPITGVLEKFYVYNCPHCNEKKEIISREHDNMQDNTEVICSSCGNKFILEKQTSEDYKAPSLADSFGDFFKKGTTPEELKMLPEKELQDVLNAIQEKTGIEINRDTVEKLPVGIKRILKDILNI